MRKKNWSTTLHRSRKFLFLSSPFGTLRKRPERKSWWSAWVSRLECVPGLRPADRGWSGCPVSYPDKNCASCLLSEELLSHKAGKRQVWNACFQFCYKTKLSDFLFRLLPTVHFLPTVYRFSLDFLPLAKKLSSQFHLFLNSFIQFFCFEIFFQRTTKWSVFRTSLVNLNLVGKPALSMVLASCLYMREISMMISVFFHDSLNTALVGTSWRTAKQFTTNIILH